MSGRVRSRWRNYQVSPSWQAHFLDIEFILPKNYYEKLQIVSGKTRPNRPDSDESPSVKTN